MRGLWLLLYRRFGMEDGVCWTASFPVDEHWVGVTSPGLALVMERRDLSWFSFKHVLSSAESRLLSLDVAMLHRGVEWKAHAMKRKTVLDLHCGWSTHFDWLCRSTVTCIALCKAVSGSSFRGQSSTNQVHLHAKLCT